jgi:hypothetical protein
VSHLAKTYNEWKSEGFAVKAGERSCGRNDDGRAVFAPCQVEPIGMRNADRPKMRGKIFMVQSNLLSGQKDGHDNPTVHWPGRAVWFNKQEARDVGKVLAQENEGVGFYLMEAVALFQTELPAIHTTTFKMAK